MWIIRRSMGNSDVIVRLRRASSPLAFALLLAGLVLALGAIAQGPLPAAAVAKPGGHNGGKGGKKRGSLKYVVTGRRAELRDTVPIANHVGQKTRSVLSVKLPQLRTGQRIRFSGEVVITTTCVDPSSRCIGRSYGYDPHLRAQIVLARRAQSHRGRSTKPISNAVSLTCEQTRPNRNHHCPLTVRTNTFKVNKLKKLPCKPKKCRLNMIVDATSDAAGGNEFVVVGSDQPNGSVEGGKARLSAAISSGRIEISKQRTTRRISNQIDPAFEGGKTVVFSQKLGNLQAGDVLLINARQRTAIKGLPYFVSNQIVVTTKRRKTRPSRLTRRIIARSGLASETTGFNCTLGPSAFRSPCVAVKVGMAYVESTPKRKNGKPQPLYVNLVSRSFPKLAQGRYPPAQVLRGGMLKVKRLRVAERNGGGKGGGKGGHGGKGRNSDG